MAIRLAPPIKAKKEPLCRGDEATVSRIMSGRFKGMVERLQDSSESCFRDGTPFQMLQVVLGPEIESLMDIHSVPNTSIMYPVFQFLSLRAAGLMFPGNFLTPRHLHLSSTGNRTISAMYSDFVPDESGRVQRTQEYRSKFYDGMQYATWEQKERFRMEADAEEQRLCPELAPFVKMVMDAGIIPAHPEANYQISGGKIVFFEVQSINPLAAADYCSEALTSNTPAREMLALIHMVALREFATRLFRACPYMAAVGEWSRAPLTNLMWIFSSNFGKRCTTEHDRLFHSGKDIVKEHIDHLPQQYRFERPITSMPVQIDEGIFELI